MDVPPAPIEAEDEVQRIIGSIEPRNVAGLRDRAIVALIAYAGASVQEVVEMRIRDYLDGGGRAWVQLGVLDTVRLIEITPRVREYIEEYITAANIPNIRGEDSFSLLFRMTGNYWNRGIYNKGIKPRAAEKSIRDRIAKAREALSPDEVAHLLKSIRGRAFANRRDRAILGLMLYASASPETIARLRMDAYCLGGDRPRLRLGAGVLRDVSETLAKLLDDYLTAIHWTAEGRSPIFRGRGTRSITPVEIYRMIENRRAGRRPRLASRILTEGPGATGRSQPSTPGDSRR